MLSGEWEELDSKTFFEDELWTSHIKKLVKGDFVTEYRDDIYEHTTYFIIFDVENNIKKSDVAQKYYECYSIHFVTRHKKLNSDTLSKNKLINIVKTFALKGELPYVPEYSPSKREQIAYSTLKKELQTNSGLKEVQELQTLIGKLTLVNDVLFNSCQYIKKDDGIFEVYTLELNCIEAYVSVNIHEGGDFVRFESN